MLSVLCGFHPAAVPALSQSALAQPVEPRAAAAAVEEAIIDAISAAENSVVAVWRVSSSNSELQILAPRPDPLRNFLRRPEPLDPTSADFIAAADGAGVIIGEAGLILTSFEVVRPDDSHWVTLTDQRARPAKLIAADARSGLAVLQIRDSGLAPIRFSSPSELRRGQFAIALGNPHAIARDGQPSASWGIISNIGRKATSPNVAQRTIHEFGSLVQTDAKLNLGTEGGPLINLRGEMIRLTTTLAATAGYDAAAGYAIPIDNFFRRAVEALRQGREVEYGFLGVGPADELPLRAGEQGMVIRNTLAGTPAFEAGLRRDDRITHVADQPVYDFDSLLLHIARQPPQAIVAIRYQRAAETLSVAVPLSKSSVVPGSYVSQPPEGWRGIQVDYSTAVENYSDLLNSAAIDPLGCVLVRSVERDSPAWKSGVRENTFVSHVGERRVATPAEFRRAVEAAEQDSDLGDVTLRVTQAIGDARQITVNTDL